MEKVKFSDIRLATNDEWDLIFQKCDYGTFFHSRDWAEIWCIHAQGKWQPQPQLFSFTDGKTALIPLVVQKYLGGLISKGYSCPNYSYGGWISEDELDVQHVQLLTNWLLTTKSINYLMWRFNPYDTLLQKTGAISPEINSVRYEIYSQFTNVIDLRDDLENVLKRWSKGHRGAFNKAVKGGVSVELASTFEEWMDYYQIFQENSKRWEKGKAGFAEDYDRRMFEIIFDRKSPNIRLWLARHEGKSIAGAICLYAKNHVLGWHLTALSEYLNLRPTHLLNRVILIDAHERNYWWYDLMDSVECSEGVKAFKQGFGAVEMPCPLIIRQDNLLNSLQFIKKKFLNY